MNLKKINLPQDSKTGQVVDTTRFDSEDSRDKSFAKIHELNALIHAYEYLLSRQKVFEEDLVLQHEHLHYAIISVHAFVV